MFIYKKATLKNFTKSAGKQLCLRVFLLKLHAGKTKFSKIQVKTCQGSYLNIVAAKGMELVSKFIGTTRIENSGYFTS